MNTGAHVSEKEVQKLEKLSKTELPADLKKLYKELGVIQRKEDEIVGLNIHDVSRLIVGLEKTLDPKAYNYQKIYSLGIVDMIKESWSNDRYEFDAESGFFSQSDLDFLNDRYKCFGYFRTLGGYDGAHYLYFDQAGNYGSFYYNQDQIPTDMKAILVKQSTESSLWLFLQRKIEFLRLLNIYDNIDSYETEQIIKGFKGERETDKIIGIGIVDLISSSFMRYDDHALSGNTINFLSYFTKQQIILPSNK